MRKMVKGGRRLLASIVVCVCVASGAIVAQGQTQENLLPNGGFENGVKDWNWEQWKNLPQPGYLNKEDPYKGLASYTMTLPDSKRKDRWITTGTKKIDPDKDYVLSLAMRGEGLPKGSVMICMMQWGTEKSDKVEPQGWVNRPGMPGVLELLNCGGTFEWKEFRIPIDRESIKSSTIRVTLFIKNFSIDKGKLGIDEVSLTPVEGGIKDVYSYSAPYSYDDGRLDFFGLPRWLEGAFGWTDKGKGNPIQVKLDEKVFHSEPMSLCIQQGDKERHIHKGNFLRIEQSGVYRLTAWIKADSLPEEGAWIYLHSRRIFPPEHLGYAFRHGAMGVWKLIQTGGTHDWKKFQTLVDINGGNDTEIAINFAACKGSGTVWFDDVSFEKVPQDQLDQKEKEKESQPAANAGDEKWDFSQYSVVESEHFIIPATKQANIFEGKNINLLFLLKNQPSGLNAVDCEIKNYFGEIVHRERYSSDALEQRNTISLSDIQGWFQFTLKAEGSGGKLLDTATSSFVALEKMPDEYYQKRPESMFGGWGAIETHMNPAHLGIKWMRSCYYWKFLQPKEGGPITIIDSPPEKSDLAYLMVIGHGNLADWQRADPRTDEGVGPIKDLDAYLHFVRTIVAAKKDAVDAWEVWNEPYFGNDTMWPGTREEYFKIHKAVYETIKRIDPEATVIGPCLQPFRHMHDIKVLFEMGILKYCDGVSIHPYCQNQSPESAGFRQMLQSLKKLMRENGGEKPIWNTEWGWHGDKEGPIGGPENQARYTVRSLLMQLAENVRCTIYWTMWNSDFENDTPKARWRGAFSFFNTRNSTPKPVAAAYGVLTRLLYRSEFVRDISGFNDTTHALLFNRENGGHVLALWDHYRKRDVLLRATDDITVVDIMGNRSTIEPQGGLLGIEIGEDPVYVLGLSREDIALNDRLINAGGYEGGDTGDIVSVPLQKDVLPSGTGEVVLRYLGPEKMQSACVPLQKTGGVQMARFSPNFSAGETTGLVRVFVEAPDGAPLGFCLVNVKPLLAISKYYLTKENNKRYVCFDYEVAKSGGLGGSIEFTDEDGRTERISVRFRKKEGRLKTLLPAGIKNGRRYNLRVVYSLEGGIAEALETPFYYVPATRARREIAVDGDLGDWSNAEFIDFRSDPFFCQGVDSGLECQFALQWDTEKLYLCVRVENDEFRQDMPKSKLGNAWEQDSIQVGIDPFKQERVPLRPTGETQYVADEWPFYHYTIAELEGQAHVIADFSPCPRVLPKGTVDPEGIKSAIQVNRRKKKIVYEISFDRKLLQPAELKPGVKFGFSVACNDSDPDRPERRALEWSSGLVKGKVFQKFGNFFLVE